VPKTVPKCEPVPRITTEVAERVVPVSVPEALAPVPTHTLANEGELPLRSVNLVVPVTSTVQLPPFCDPTPKLPVAPLLPHEPLLVSPLTDTTLPEIRGWENQTLVAVTVVPEVVPIAPAQSPTQRSEKALEPEPAS
jgi:hypothetical protein